MPHRQGLLPGVRRIDYFRFDTETTTWTEDPGFDYFLDIGDFRHFTSYRRSFSDVRRETPTLSQPYFINVPYNLLHLLSYCIALHTMWFRVYSDTPK
jgi:hypothetical protein